MNRAAEGMTAGLQGVRTALLWGLLAAGLAVSVLSSVTLARHIRDNAVIARLAEGHDVAVPLTEASPDVLFARAGFLLARGRLDEAQSIADITASWPDPALRARLLYNLANARVRLAVQHIEAGAYGRAIPLVALAKTGYRLALRLSPGVWDVKYNLDVAMRLVRDFPESGEAGEMPPETPPKRVWTDLPGTPRGLP